MEKGYGAELPPKILIVDDHHAARTTLRELLDGHSFQVCGDAQNGKEAIEKVMELKPDIVLLERESLRTHRTMLTRLPARTFSSLCPVIRMLCQMIANSVPHYLAHGAAIQLLHDILPMNFGCLDAETEDVCEFLSAPAFSY